MPGGEPVGATSSASRARGFSASPPLRAGLVAALLVLARGAGAQAPIPPGEVVGRLACAHDPSQTYALYLPSGYRPDQRQAVLYAFDPMARGDARQALAELRRAAGLGFRDADRLREEPEWAPLRDLPAFRAALAELDAVEGAPR